MKDKTKTTFSFVMYPEKTPIIEAYRASEELKTVGIETQMVIANLIISKEEVKTPFFRNRINMQEKYLRWIKSDFINSQLIKVQMYDKEIKGIDMLTKIGDCIF